MIRKASRQAAKPGGGERCKTSGRGGEAFLPYPLCAYCTTKQAVMSSIVIGLLRPLLGPRGRGVAWNVFKEVAYAAVKELTEAIQRVK